MAKHFLYIDDENDKTTAAIADGLKIKGMLDITSLEPREFKRQKQYFIEHQEFDGIILDLRLDGKRLDIPYNAPALAQELRMMAAERQIKSVPIVLCSTLEKMRATYDIDKTSHDLFDYKFHKQDSPPWEKFARKISSLSTGYRDIEERKFDLNSIFHRDLNVFDTGIFEKFTGLDKPLPTYDYASLVIKDFFHHPGLLIKERLLASRLGIDIAESGDNWVKLLESVFRDAEYQGVFCDGWQRWWVDIVLDIFKTNTGKRLAQLNAEERVKLIEAKFGVSGLKVARPIERNVSTRYWTICEYFKRPLDPIEGFKIHTSIEPKSWQENKFISLEAALSKKGPKPHSSELSRIELIKESLKK